MFTNKLTNFDILRLTGKHIATNKAPAGYKSSLQYHTPQAAAILQTMHVPYATGVVYRELANGTLKCQPAPVFVPVTTFLYCFQHAQQNKLAA